MSLMAIPAHVALVDKTGKIEHTELANLAGALNSQIQNDFAHVWGVRATVGVYPQAPLNTWAIYIQDQLDEPGALGYHTDENNQPVSYVEHTSDYSVTVSHELMEMLADPFGSRMTKALLPKGIDPYKLSISSRTLVSYLVEVSDPCEAASYLISDVNVSDFLLPAWYRSATGPGISYSHTGYCKTVRDVADGGYVSFSIPGGEWFQVFNQGGNLSLQDIGNFDKSKFGSLREWMDHKAREYRASWR